MEGTGETATYLTVTVVSFCAFCAVMELLSGKLFGRLIPAHYHAFTADNKRILDSSFASSLNSLIMFVSSVCLLTHSNLRKDPCWYDSFPVRLLCCLEVGYNIADIVSMLRTDVLPGKRLYIFHHLVVLCSLYVVLVHRLFAFFFCLRALNELSVPFMHTRWLLAKLKKKCDTCYFINGLMFMFAFFLSRICLIPITFYSIYGVTGTPQWERVGLFGKGVLIGNSVLVDSLNVYWFRLLARGAYAQINSKFVKRKSS